MTSGGEGKQYADDWNRESAILILIGFIKQATCEGIHLDEQTGKVRFIWVILDLNNYETEFFDVEVEEGVEQEWKHCIKSGLTVGTQSGSTTHHVIE